jgi:sporulation protein YlmC with PRC-barrel domain
MMTIKISPNDKGNPVGKLADVELHFTDGPLAGLKLIGFAIWERRGGNGRNVTFPARQYTVNGDRRSFALLRPIQDVGAQDGIRTAILEAYDAFEREQATADAPYTGRSTRSDW